MPTARQILVEVAPTSRALNTYTGDRAEDHLSTSDTAQLAQMYPASPIHSGDITDDERKRHYQDEVLSAEINDGGHTFGTVSTDYVDAPNLAEVDIDKNNLPSPYVPNPTSPGPGSQNDADKGPAPDGFGLEPSSEAYGPGAGSQLSPRDASARVARQTLGEYIKGSSSSESAS